MKKHWWLSLLLTSSLSAQTPTERAQISSWYDSLQDLSSVSSLTQFAALSAGTSGALHNLRQSLYRVRAGQLEQRQNDIQRGMDNLMQDISQHPDWVWPRFALVEELMDLHRERAMNNIWPGQVDGESLLESSFRHLRLLLEKDPEFQPARNLFLDMLVAGGERELHGDQMVVLRQEMTRAQPDARALLGWGRYLHSQALYDSALKVFTRATFAGGDPSRLALERAHSFNGLRDTAAAREAYWDGLDHLTKTGRAAYRYDLAWMLSKDSLAVFDKVPDDSLLRWVHRFWDSRDAAAANHFGERLQENLRRWNFAVANFRVTQPWRKTDFSGLDMAYDGIVKCVTAATRFYEDLWALQPMYENDLRYRERLLDNRGIIYLHHGAPLKTFGGGYFYHDFSGIAIEPPLAPEPPLTDPPTPPGMSQYMYQNISWLYWFGGASRLLNFRGSTALGNSAPTTLAAFLPLNSDVYADMVNSGIDEYARAAAAFTGRMPPGIPTPPPSIPTRGLSRPGNGGPDQDAVCEVEAFQKVIAKARSDAETAISTDSDNPPLLTPWNGVVKMLALGSATEHNGKALITFAVPANKLQSEPGPDGHPVWPLVARIVAYDNRTDQTITIDSVRHFAATPKVAKDQYLTGWFDLPLGPGDWQLVMRLHQGSDSSGMFSMDQHLIIPARTTLSLSDIIPGRAGAPNWMAPDSHNFPVNALWTWKQATDMLLYFEVRGVSNTMSYQTSIQILAAGTKAKPLLEVNSTDLSSGEFTPVRKSLSLSQLAIGDYQLVITISANGQHAERSMPFTVVMP